MCMHRHIYAYTKITQQVCISISKRYNASSYWPQREQIVIYLDSPSSTILIFLNSCIVLAKVSFCQLDACTVIGKRGVIVLQLCLHRISTYCHACWPPSYSLPTKSPVLGLAHLSLYPLTWKQIHMYKTPPCRLAWRGTSPPTE